MEKAEKFFFSSFQFLNFTKIVKNWGDQLYFEGGTRGFAMKEGSFWATLLAVFEFCTTSLFFPQNVRGQKKGE